MVLFSYYSFLRFGLIHHSTPKGIQVTQPSEGLPISSLLLIKLWLRGQLKRIITGHGITATVSSHAHIIKAWQNTHRGQ